MVNDALLDRTFAACAHPIRRGILEQLAAGEMSVAQATSGFGVSKPAISRHLRVLEEAGAIVRVVDGRKHRLRIAGGSLQEAQRWLERQRVMWERKLDAVEGYLAEQAMADERKGQS